MVKEPTKYEDDKEEYYLCSYCGVIGPDLQDIPKSDWILYRDIHHVKTEFDDNNEEFNDLNVTNRIPCQKKEVSNYFYVACDECKHDAVETEFDVEGNIYFQKPAFRKKRKK